MAKSEMGHTPVKNGLWTVCSVCKMTKRKAGWWKACEGEKPAKRYMAG